ncbi:hypothetical protein [Pedobacter sp. WC2423]
MLKKEPDPKVYDLIRLFFHQTLYSGSNKGYQPVKDEQNAILG